MPSTTNTESQPIQTIIRGGKSSGADAPVEASKLLDRVREVLRARRYSRGTEQTYCLWIKRFIDFHNVRHSAEMAGPEITAFLTNLAVKDKISASTRNQALSALLFFYRHVLDREMGDLGKAIRAGKQK